VRIDDISARPGEVIRVPIQADNVAEMAGADLSLSYNPDLLEFISVDTGDLTEGYVLATNAATPGVLHVSFSHLQETMRPSGNLLNIQFQVNSSVTGEALSPLALTSAQCSDLNGLDFSTSPRRDRVEMQSGQITVSSNMTGNIYLPFIRR
jgi:hypothetical protein